MIISCSRRFGSHSSGFDPIRTLFLLSLAAALFSGCDNNQPSGSGAEVPAAIPREVGQETEGAEVPAVPMLYPEFERQMRVDRIAALGVMADVGATAFEVCASCHGQDGLGSRDGEKPRLAGQQQKVLIEKLIEISDGVRHRSEMEPWLAHIDTDDEIAALAAFLTALPEPALVFQGTGEALVLGENLFGRYCISCHGDNGMGNGETRVPRIAGWDFASVRRTLIRQGAERGEIHETGMSDLVSMFDEPEINAISDYVSRLAPAPIKDLP